MYLQNFSRNLKSTFRVTLLLYVSIAKIAIANCQWLKSFNASGTINYNTISSDCASCTSDCAGAGQAIPRVPNPTIKLTLEDDSVLECAVLTTFDVEDFGEYIALIPLDKNGKNKSGETFLFRYHEENGNPVINNIEREDEYMAAAESFHNFIENLPHKDVQDELEE